MTTLTNHLLCVFKDWPHVLLDFIHRLKMQLLLIPELPSALTYHLIYTFYRIFSKLYCSERVDFSYYSAMNILPTLRI